MSGGGGHIIIRSAVKQAAQVESVKDNLSPGACAKLNSVLNKNENDWTHFELAEVLFWIGEADYHCSK